MKHQLLTGVTLLTISAAFGRAAFGQTRLNAARPNENSVVISQSGGAGNSATVSQSGAGNRVSINQSGGSTTSGSKPGNRVSLRVAKGTQTEINQASDGPNAVELSQAGQATAIINQSSGTDENTVTTLPDPKPAQPRTRPAKRRHRRS